MFLIIGLGNPGKEYEKTKHNAGFRTVDFLAGKYDLEWTDESKKLLSEVSSGKIDSQKVILAKPITFMNNSGKAVALLTKSYKPSSRAQAEGLKAESCFIFHDDSDLPLGKIKISFGKSSGGHKGVESIIKALKTKEFWRIRIGIQSSKKHIRAEKLVLQKFKPEEEKVFAKVVKTAAEAAETMILESPEKAMSLFNK